MNSELEERLARQTPREIPMEWRAEILRGHEAERPWWQEWLWPSPKAWGGLAAAWGVVFLLHFAAPSGSASVSVKPMDWQTFARLQHELEMTVELPDAPPAQPAYQRPRSCRRTKYETA
jgi:hypothetical protein